jgi:alpha-glutamyl/putrescinyl thymine pyrophosphorylase-like protein
VRPRDRNLAKQLDERLKTFDQQKHRLPGIRVPANRETLLEQLIESIHRVKYISVIRTRKLSDLRADPSNELFDPLKAAVLHQRKGQIDEAFWLVFLSVHFGKNGRTGWRLARDVYGRLGGRVTWDWARTSADPKGFRRWLEAHQAALKDDGTSRLFGNHRKYQSLDANSPAGTGAAIESYVNCPLCQYPLRHFPQIV